MKRKIIWAVVIVVALIGSGLCGNYIGTFNPQREYVRLLVKYNSSLDTITDLAEEINEFEEERVRVEEQHRSDIKTAQNRYWGLKVQYWRLEDMLVKQVDEFNLRIENLRDKFIDELRYKDAEIWQLEREAEALRDLAREHQGDWANTRDFENIEELVTFLLEDDTNELQYVPEDSDCDDFKTYLMMRAVEKGYRILPCWLWYLDDNRITGWHSLNYAIVHETTDDGKDVRVVIVIEPQTDWWFIVGRVDKPETWRDKLFPILPW